MLTHPEYADDDESPGAIGSRPASAGGRGADGEDSASNLSDAEPWALVSLGGQDLEDTAVVNNLSGLDLNSIDQESGVSSLSGTNGIALDGQTILSSLGPEVDEADDNDDRLLLPGPNNQDANTMSNAAAENDDLSIPDTVPSNIRSIRSGALANMTARHRTSHPDKKNSKREIILFVSFVVLFSGVTFLASTWRRSALRLEAELAALRNLKLAGRESEKVVIAGGAKAKPPPLFADQQQKGTPSFTVADNCYIKAEASVSLGSCGSELRDNLQNASSRIRRGFEQFTRKFDEAFWAFGGDDDVDNNTTGTFFSSSSSFFSGSRAADGASQTFSRFAKFWDTKRDRWNKASRRFVSELNVAANRTAENVHHTLNQANEAIEQSVSSFIDHARDAIEEGTSVVREVNVKEGKDVRTRSTETSLGAKSLEGFHRYLNDIFSNITSVNFIAGEIPALGSSK